MRLTLRTLLAWLDDTLPPSQVREIGKQVSESPYAWRADRADSSREPPAAAHCAPEHGPGGNRPEHRGRLCRQRTEPDTVAEYEKKCLTSDVNLAEVACVHQILSLLGQKVNVPVEAKARMYHLVKGRGRPRNRVLTDTSRLLPNP